jgi:rhodanese-related sulfurtransferase
MAYQKRNPNPSKTFISIFCFLLALFLILNGCRSIPVSTPTTSPSPSNIPTAQSAVKIVNSKEAKALMNENKGLKDFVIIDVRTAPEFSSGHMENDINIDIYKTDFKSSISALDRNSKYLIYCQTGIRSAQAARIMDDLGFKEIYDLNGGIAQWIQDGNSVVK